MKLRYVIVLFFLFFGFLNASEKKLAYLVSDVRIPFWSIMTKGIKIKAKELGYKIDVYSANNLKKKELENTIKSLSSNIDGLILSPINSSTAVTIMKFAKKYDVPVVISDIGAESDDYISYISSDNEDGGYKIGKVLTKKMNEMGWNKDGTVGIVAIPQKRENGKARTKGFLKALSESNIKMAGIRKQVDFSYKETYDFSTELINKNPNIKALWLQGSDRYLGALDAIKDAGKENDIILLCFDAEPIFLELISNGVLLGSAMQQPLLMGKIAVESMDRYLNNKSVQKQIKLPVLAISKENIDEKMSIIERNVLGIIEQDF